MSTNDSSSSSSSRKNVCYGSVNFVKEDFSDSDLGAPLAAVFDATATAASSTNPTTNGSGDHASCGNTPLRWTMLFLLLLLIGTALTVSSQKDMNSKISSAVLNTGMNVELKVDADSDADTDADVDVEQDAGDADCDSVPLRYTDQLVDHFNTIPSTNNNTWSQEYYASSKYFGGPGHAIFVIIGGEGVPHKILYPFISEHLAKVFQAFVIQPEHRFYGASRPITVKHNSDLIGYLTAEQAMADIVRLVQHTQSVLHCSTQKSSSNYCPVITVGGSYPGFLSAMLRFVYPHVVDISYASSAPLHLYAQQVQSTDYYEFITKIADGASPGCAASTKAGLLAIQQMLLSPYGSATSGVGATDMSIKDIAKKLHICTETIPSYMTHSHANFAREVIMIMSSSYADFNMGYYPPKDETTQLMMACAVFQNTTNTDLWDKATQLLRIIAGDGSDDDDSDDAIVKREQNETCFELLSFLPAGTHATISSADWSGAGDGNTGRSWEFQLCTELIVQTGFSDASMFPPREWTLEWLTAHCQSRFGVTPQPYRLVDLWGFDDLVGNGASRILFTNGLNDAWSVSSILENLSDTILAVNFPNGAHHSDLSHEGPNENDTDDITAGYVQIQSVLTKWLEEIRKEQR